MFEPQELVVIYHFTKYLERFPFTLHWSNRAIFIGYSIYIVKYSARVHMAKDARACKCVSAI